jgi:hypothetical protein
VVNKAKAPLRLVVARERGPRSQRIELPNGDVAIVCGPSAYLDRLECGHEVVAYSAAERRRCQECVEAVS